MSIHEWQQFVQSSLTECPLVAINSDIVNETIVSDLSHLGLLQLSGSDASTFLQGQVTNDVRLLDGSRAHYSGYCSPKGRLLALFLAFTHQNRLHLQMPKELIEGISKRMRMYIMRSKVEIQDVSDHVIRIGVSGQQASESLSKLFQAIPQETLTSSSAEYGTLLKLPGTHARFEIFTDIANAPHIWHTLLSQAKPASASYWEWLDIQAGIPDVVLKTQEEFVPQMLNLDLVGGINFKKGCYTGQEIIARTHYLGTIKRRTYLAKLNGSTKPAAGDEVVNHANEIVGKVARSAESPWGGYDVLAEIRQDSLSNHELSVNAERLTIGELPYKLEPSTSS
ncbi:MAG: folate-binding protein YgfZ [Betaproteobacteria bacterium]|nr:folate-binding protein YgfZ [Betaproteobacteria bacterium]